MDYMINKISLDNTSLDNLLVSGTIGVLREVEVVRALWLVFIGPLYL